MVGLRGRRAPSAPWPARCSPTGSAGGACCSGPCRSCAPLIAGFLLVDGAGSGIAAAAAAGFVADGLVLGHRGDGPGLHAPPPRAGRRADDRLRGDRLGASGPRPVRGDRGRGRAARRRSGASPPSRSWPARWPCCCPSPGGRRGRPRDAAAARAAAPGRRRPLRRGGRGAPRADPAAGRPHAPRDARRGGRPARPARARAARLREAIAGDRVPSMVLYGPPGSGKTTLARVVARSTEAAFEELSAVSATVADVRAVMARARDRLAAGRPHGALPRRDPPLQPGPAGRPAARRRGRARHPDRRDHPEPLVRGQRRPRLADAGVGAGAARARGRRRARRPRRSPSPQGLAGRVRLGEEARGARSSRAPAATPAARSTCSRPRPRARPTAQEVGPRGGAVRPPAGARWSTTARATRTTTRSRPSSRACAPATRTPPIYYLAVMLTGGEDPKYIARRLIVAASEDVGQRRPAGAGGGGRGRARGRVRGPARRRASPRPGDDVHRARAQVERLIPRRSSAALDARRARGRPPAAARAARRQPPQRPQPRSRRGLPLPARQPRRACSTSRCCPRAWRACLLPPHRSRTRGRAVGAAARAARAVARRGRRSRSEAGPVDFFSAQHLASSPSRWPVRGARPGGAARPGRPLGHPALPRPGGGAGRQRGRLPHRARARRGLSARGDLPLHLTDAATVAR